MDRRPPPPPPTREVPRTDPSYPAALRDDPAAPSPIFLRGTLRDTDLVAVVGTRGARIESLRRASQLAEQLVGHGLGVVSGGALGVDTAAHEGALAAGGYTVAVLGSGLDRLYPERNLALFAEIAARGALVSPFSSDTPPRRPNFPGRNRVIASWALAVVVIEAPVRSGALNTAAWARRLGRPVLALPEGAGSTALLQRGQAGLVEQATDVLDVIRGRPPRPWRATPADPDQRRIHALLLEASGDLSVDETAARVGWTAARTAAALIRLELAGLARMTPGGRYADPGRPGA